MHLLSRKVVRKPITVVSVRNLTELKQHIRKRELKKIGYMKHWEKINAIKIEVCMYQNTSQLV